MADDPRDLVKELTSEIEKLDKAGKDYLRKFKIDILLGRARDIAKETVDIEDARLNILTKSTDKIIQNAKNIELIKKGKAEIQDFTADIAELEQEILEAIEHYTSIGHTELAKNVKELGKAKMDQLQASQLEAEAQQMIAENYEMMMGPARNLVKQAKLFTRALLTNPLIMLAAAAVALAKILIDIVKETIELRKELGLSVKEAVKLQYNMRRAHIETALYGAKLDDVRSTAQALLKEFGRTDITTRRTLATLTKFQMTLGLSADDGARLLKTLESVSGLSEQMSLNTIEMVAEMARAAKVAPAQIMEELASNTEHFAEFARDGGKHLIRAAIEARKLGIEFDKVASISDHLLDIETSIEKQMTASVLLGRNINLERARELAFLGKEDEMLSEIRRQVGERAEFERMNVVQRRALAEAVGMDVASLARLYDVREEAIKQQKPPETAKEEMRDVSDKISEMLILMKKGGIVKMDGKKVGEVIAMAQTPAGIG